MSHAAPLLSTPLDTAATVMSMADSWLLNENQFAKTRLVTQCNIETERERQVFQQITASLTL